MEKKNRSEWWFLANINFIMVGILYLVSMIILLAGNFIELTIPPTVAGIIAGILVVMANFLGTKLAFREGQMGQKEFMLFCIYSIILYLVLAFTFVPLIMKFTGFLDMNGILCSIIVGLVLFITNFLFVFNLNSNEEEKKEG